VLYAQVFLFESAFAAVFRGGLTCDLLEQSAEIMKVEHAAVLCYRLYLKPRVFKQMFCIAYSFTVNEFGEGRPCGLFEKGGKIAFTDSAFFCKSLQTQLFCKVAVYGDDSLLNYKRKVGYRVLSYQLAVGAKHLGHKVGNRRKGVQVFYPSCKGGRHPVDINRMNSAFFGGFS